jgi:pimeloyl-ACP methyl ester carboxylesterase
MLSNDFKEGVLHTNGIELHYVEKGDGPLVVFCHGWPESWYSWRHQLNELGSNGYRAVALHMRGYGKTSKPKDVEAYGITNLVGDVVGAVNELGASEAVVVGHDWGGPVAWNSALMRPDIFRAVAVLSVPFNPPIALPHDVSLNDVMAANAGDRDYYRLFFQEPGVAEADLERDVRLTMLGILYSISGNVIADGARSEAWDGHFPKGETMSQQLVIPESLPDWLTQADLDFYVQEMTSAGFRGGLNWYRNIKRMPGLLAPFIGRTITQPALYLHGEHDPIAGNTPAAIQKMKEDLPDLRGCIEFEGAGHWLQQERAEGVNTELLGFLRAL